MLAAVRISKPVLLVGALRRETVAGLSAAAKEAELAYDFVPSVDEAIDWLAGQVPSAIAVATNDPDAEKLFLHVRSDGRLVNAPAIGIAPSLDDLVFPEVYGWGGDDVIAETSTMHLVPRLRALVANGDSRRAGARGIAIVASDDPHFRVVTGRVLHNAGYDVRFEITAAAAASAATAVGAALVVSNDDAALATIGEVIATARAGLPALPWVVVAEPKRLANATQVVSALRGVAVTDAFAPPENVIFVANELSRSQQTDGRASARLLYGTLVCFRIAGRDEDQVGFTYNVSGSGLFVRTLAPLAMGEDAWVELRPPRSDRRVRFEGRVAWTRRFGANDTATAPPGFGVQIVDGCSGDLQRYRDGYRAFAAQTLGAP